MTKIPNLQIENISTKGKPLQVIKGFIELPCWNGHYLYDESFPLKKEKLVTNGRIELWVDGEITDERKIAVSPEQANAYLYLQEHQEEIRQTILNTLKTEFPRLLSNEYASWDHEAAYFPRINDLTDDFDFKDYIGPESINIGEEVKAEAAYVQWRFRCRWDIEHGFEVITHNSRVIDIAPEADIFKMAKDNGTFEDLQRELENKVWKLPRKKKKWWQLW